MDLESIKQTFINFLPNLSLALVILCAFFIASMIIKGIITNKLLKRKSNPALIKLIAQISSTLLIIVGFISAFGTSS